MNQVFAGTSTGSKGSYLYSVIGTSLRTKANAENITDYIEYLSHNLEKANTILNNLKPNKTKHKASVHIISNCNNCPARAKCDDMVFSKTGSCKEVRDNIQTYHMLNHPKGKE